MTPTEELRARLDELGVRNWEGDDERRTLWESNGLTWEYFNDDNGDAWLGFLGACEHDVSPEQAIAATVGGKDVSALRAKVKAQGDYIDKLRGEYKALDEQMERRCDEYRHTIRKLKAELDAAMVGAGTCKLVIEKRPRHGPWIYHFGCGYDFWLPTDCPMPVLKHCPNCGKRIAKED